MKRPFEHPLLCLRRLVRVEGGLRLLDEREHVTHPEDAARHAIGMEDLEVLELLAHAGEEDRDAGHLLHRERGTTARVAVELREHHAAQRHGRGERLGDTDGLLAGHRVDDEQHVVRRDRVGHRRQLAHQVVVDLQTTGGVDDHGRAAGALRLLDPGARHGDGIGSAR